MKLKDFKQSNILVGLYIDEHALANEKQFHNTIYSITKQQEVQPDLVVFHSGLNKDVLKKVEDILKDPVATYAKVNAEGVKEEKEEKIEKGEAVNYTLVNTKSESFAQLFNELFSYAFDNEYEFFSIMEQEDVFALHWFKYVQKYASEKENVGAFSPLMRHTVNSVYQGIINEIPWVEGIAEEAGITDINILLKAETAINILGCAFRVSKLIEHLPENENGGYSPMKESMKLINAYEFFLRIIYDDIKVLTIPRNGYELNYAVRDSYNPLSSKIPSNITQLPQEKGGITQQEAKFYIDLARKEYFFEEDRNIVFEG